MIDDLVKDLEAKRQTITKERYKAWQRDEVTQELINDLRRYMIERLNDDAPMDLNECVAFTHQRAGAKAVVDSVMSWIPYSVQVQEQQEGDNE